MGHANNRITEPVSPVDVSIIIGEASFTINVLCYSRKPKTWARYKPYNINQVEDINDSQRAARNWGITNIPHFNNASAMAQFLIDGSMGDGSVSLGPWFTSEVLDDDIDVRIDDYIGYWHGAKEPLELSAADIIILPGSVTITMTPTDPAQIKLTELSVPGSMAAGMGQMYLGLLVTDGTESRIETLTEPFSTIENAGGSHSIILPTDITGSCTICAVLCSRTYTWDDYLSSSPDTPTPASNGTDGTDTPIVVSDYVPLTWTKQTITLVRPLAEISCEVDGVYNPNASILEALVTVITLKFTNSSDIAANLGTLTVSVTDKQGNELLSHIYVPAVTIPANTTKTVTVEADVWNQDGYAIVTYDYGGKSHLHRGKIHAKDAWWMGPDDVLPGT